MPPGRSEKQRRVAAVAISRCRCQGQSFSMPLQSIRCAKIGLSKYVGKEGTFDIYYVTGFFRCYLIKDEHE